MTFRYEHEYIGEDGFLHVERCGPLDLDGNEIPEVAAVKSEVEDWESTAWVCRGCGATFHGYGGVHRNGKPTYHCSECDRRREERE